MTIVIDLYILYTLHLPCIIFPSSIEIVYMLTLIDASYTMKLDSLFLLVLK